MEWTARIEIEGVLKTLVFNPESNYLLLIPNLERSEQKVVEAKYYTLQDFKKEFGNKKLKLIVDEANGKEFKPFIEYMNGGKND